MATPITTDNPASLGDRQPLLPHRRSITSSDKPVEKEPTHEPKPQAEFSNTGLVLSAILILLIPLFLTWIALNRSRVDDGPVVF